MSNVIQMAAAKPTFNREALTPRDLEKLAQLRQLFPKTKGVKNYEEWIGCDEHFACVTDGFSLAYATISEAGQATLGQYFQIIPDARFPHFIGVLPEGRNTIDIDSNSKEFLNISQLAACKITDKHCLLAINKVTHDSYITTIEGHDENAHYYPLSRISKYLKCFKKLRIDTIAISTGGTLLMTVNNNYNLLFVPQPPKPKY